ncbi:MAG: glycosyltransferase, partial [Mogibacterium sp.]|nr:glycosyltransferase [Mogibacterium sp.]
IVIPCYNSSRSIREVIETAAAEMDRLGRTPFEFVLVDDHSPDGGATARELRALADDYPYVKAIELAQNAGQHNAIMAALNYAEGDIIISMDDDLQTHPSQFHVLLDEIDKGYDIVYGYYPDKKHSGFRNLGSRFNSWSVRVLIGKPKDMKTSSFWVIRKFVRDYVIQYKNPYSYMQGLFLRTTQNISCVPIEHHERVYGTSNYTLSKLIHLWSNIVGFSVVPLRIARHIGFVLSAGGLLGALWVLIRKLLHPNMQLGYASTMVAIFFFAGVILLFLGLIGEYVGRMFLCMGSAPQYVVKTVYSGAAKNEKDPGEPGTEQYRSKEKIE